MIWQELFIKRSPISEACQGVLSTLKELGLGSLVESKNLEQIRKCQEKFSVDEYVDLVRLKYANVQKHVGKFEYFQVFKTSNVKYVVMTNIPYEESEKKVWLDSGSANRADSLRNDRFRSALRIDAFLKDDWQLISDILVAKGFKASKSGLRDYLETWIKIMNPEYIIV